MLYMNINDLIAIVKKKLQISIAIEKINIEDKSFLHKNHSGHQEGKFHLKLVISSTELNKLNRIESNKKIYKALDQELKKHIHSLQILIN
jgi:BolA family transcriptional regulator, general stress-responsive regulator